jgi:GNAT superfamily N-acetyltransferase
MSDCPGATPRKLVASDIPAAAGLSEQAGWNQTEEDWRMLMDLSPEGCLAIEVHGELAATTTLLCYGRRLAWIGMVLTKVSYRGQGFARRLLTQALRLADEMQVETVKLDATDQGLRLYEQMGFRFEQAVERWCRPGSGDAADTVLPEDVASDREWQAADRVAFGADRGELLNRLAHRARQSLFASGSYVLTRPGRYTRYLGPCVCDEAKRARDMVRRISQGSGSQEWSWDLFPANKNAVAIARGLAFSPTRHLQRMVRGKDLRSKEDSIYAIAGFELG